MSMADASARIVKVGLLAAGLALMAGAVDALAAEAPSETESVVSPAETRSERAGAGSRYVPGEVIVKLKDGRTGGISILSEEAAVQSDEATLLRLEAAYGVQKEGPVFRRVHEQLRSQGSSPGGGRLGIVSSRALSRRPRGDLLRFYVLKTQRGVRAVCAELRRDPDVEYAQPNYIYHICRTPNDPDFPDQYAHQLIQMEDAWDISTGSHDTVIAILGTGVDVNHPDLKDNIWTNEDEDPNNEVDDDGNGYVDDVHGWNFEESNNNVVPDGYYDISSHETQVAGVIAAVGNNDEGVSGVNWQCSVMALRLSLELTSDEIAEALDYATANGARVVNMSFGGEASDPELDEVMKTAINNAYAQGVLLIASAGNSDTSKPHFPAAYYNVMAVASTNGEDYKTGHSTFGLWVDIAAPGTDIVTTTLDNEYIATAGTSFSAPYVAAVATLVLSHRPALTHIEVRAILENTADPVDYGDLDPELGYLGTGRVNAYEALLAADRKCPLGEIVTPEPTQTFAADVNAIDVSALVHGESYTLDYQLYGMRDWTVLSEGVAPADPNGMVSLSMVNPGVGTYELRLRVSSDGYTHTDRKLFGIEMAWPQSHWPKPDETVEAEDMWGEYFIGSPICMDVDGDGSNEIIQSSLDLASYWGGGKVDIWGADGNSLPGWPVEFETFWPSTVATGDIDGDGDYELVVASEIDNAAYAYHAESGEIVDGNWPALFGSWSGYVSAGPVLADLDGDGDSEIIIALDAESRESDGLYAFQGDGNPMWQRRYTSEGPISVADFDADGDVEICLSGYGPGLSRLYTFLLDHRGQQLERWRGGSPKGTAVADLDADGTPEIVFCTDEDVMATHADGSTVWKTEVSDALDEPGTLSIGDLNGDGLSEVYVATYIVEADGFAFTRLYGFDHEGRDLEDAGFPKIAMGPPTGCVPLIADVDGDGQQELIFAPGGEPMMAWEADGSVTPGFPTLNLSADYEITPALADLDQDGDLEFMVVADDYRFHVLDLPAPYVPELIDWGMARHDPQNSRWTQAGPRLDPISAPAEIQPGERLHVQVTASNPANGPLRWAVGNLPEGAYYDVDNHSLFWKPAADQVFHTYELSFLVTNGIRQDSRSISVAVVPNAIYHANMDVDPDWTLDEGWAWGAPTGEGSWKGDPNSGHTGDNVVGYALDGDYPDNLAETRYATVGPINCEGYKNIHLSFWRWLGVESPYDYACVQVSNDGVTWTDLWTTGPSHVSDGAWRLMEYAVPAGVADAQPTVYFRWGLGPTDDWVTCPGWNIDDVQVTGEPI